MSVGLFTIALMAFLTVVDLFAAQAILPMLRVAYDVSPASIALAVNASTLGMAIGGFSVALVGRRVERRLGVALGLGLLAIPTVLLGLLPTLPVFALLRVAQGFCMATAFTLTLAYLGERTPGAASAFAAYITGNVASNLFGRLIAAAVADHLGLRATFVAFALLNLAGAGLAWRTIRPAPPDAGALGGMPSMRASLRAFLGANLGAHLGNPALLADFGVGFCILFAFIGIFTFVNFVLARPPLSLGMMGIGLVYFAFLPSIVTTPLGGLAVARFGTRPAAWGGLAIAFVGRAATADRGSANGMYLASYFSGGLVGSVALGQAFERAGWTACVAGVGAALLVAAVLVTRLRAPEPLRIGLGETDPGAVELEK